MFFIIKAIVQSNKNKILFNVIFDTGHNLELEKKFIDELGIEVGMNIDISKLKDIKEKLDYKTGLNYCINLLSVKDRTEYEIIQKLKQKNYSEESIFNILGKLKDLNYINDERYVELWLSNNQQNTRNMSTKMIYYKLMKKGISKCLLDEKFGNIIFDEKENAYKTALKKVATIKGDKTLIRNKVYMYLIRKGFTHQSAKEAVEKILNDSEVIL